MIPDSADCLTVNLVSKDTYSGHSRTQLPVRWIQLRWAPPRPAVYRFASGAQAACILMHQEAKEKDDAVRYRSIGPAGARVAPLHCPVLSCS